MALPQDRYALEELIRAQADYARMARESCTIRNERGETVPLIFTPGQVKVTAAIDKQFKAGAPTRIIIVKARQVRMSVGCCWHIWRRTGFLPGQQAMIFGDLYKSAKNLFNYCQQFDQSYKPFLGLAKLRRLKPIKDKALKWAGGSWIEFQSAESTTTGRSYSIRHLLLDEFAYYGDAEELMGGVLQSVPDDPDTTVIINSTANGEGGAFYQLWMRSLEGRTGYAPVFFGWHEEGKYAMPLSVDPHHFERSLTDEEHQERQKYKLSPEQLNWRRWAIESKCYGSLSKFRQEYPGCAEEAFQGTGRKVFDMGAVAKQTARATAGGVLDRVRVGTTTRVQFVPRTGPGEANELQVWQRPQVGHHYVIGADVAQGIDPASKSGRNSDPDWSVAQVLDRETGEQVAMYRARVTPHTFGDQLAALGEYYNWAVLVPEANNQGVAVIETLLKVYQPYLIYKRDRLASDRRSTRLEDLGWSTTAVSKPQLISALDRAILERSITIHDLTTLMEIRTFVYHPDGKQAATDGMHDDTVIALALAVIGLRTPIPVQQSRGADEWKPQRWGQVQQPDPWRD